MALSCLCTTNVYAQDESEEDGEVVVKKAARPQNEKVYEMKEVTGVVIDDATGEPMGGVRIQALGLERYSTLTEEDGSYKLSIPVFSDAVYVYAEGCIILMTWRWTDQQQAVKSRAFITLPLRTTTGSSTV